MMYALEIQQLNKTYAGGVQAITDLSFNVEKGDFYALLGPNGAGKSTTIGIISSLVNKTSGQVKIFDHDIDHQLTQAKLQLGLVPQEFNFNLYENIEQILLQQAGYYGVNRSIAKKRAQQYLSQLELWGKRKEAARNLSGGMKRRLMIARALMHHPQLLILDEPTAGVDIELRRSMWTFLEEINAQGVTIILTTHYLEEAESLCKNIGIIDQGEMLHNTSMQELLNQVSSETFVFDLAENSPIPQLEGIEMTQSSAQSIGVVVEKGYGLNRLFAAFEAQGVKIQSMRNKENRLEALFIKLVNEGKI